MHRFARKCVKDFFGREELLCVISFAPSDDDGAAQPLSHGKLALQRIMIDKKMVIKFHDMVGVEIFFVDIYSGCCYATHD